MNPSAIEAAAKAMYDAYWPAEGRDAPNEWVLTSKRTKEIWMRMVTAAEPFLLAELREKLEEAESKIRILKAAEAFGKTATKERDLERYKALKAEKQLAELRERLLSGPALQAAADALCLNPPASEAERNEVRVEIEAALDAALPDSWGSGSDFITVREVPERNERRYSHDCEHGHEWMVPMDDAVLQPENECPECLRWLPVRLLSDSRGTE